MVGTFCSNGNRVWYEVWVEPVVGRLPVYVPLLDLILHQQQVLKKPAGGKNWRKKIV